jgi:hypothetical protein
MAEKFIGAVPYELPEAVPEAAAGALPVDDEAAPLAPDEAPPAGLAAPDAVAPCAAVASATFVV